MSSDFSFLYICYFVLKNQKTLLKTNYLKKGYLGIYSDSDVKEIFFKPVQKFPIVFEGDNHIFKIYENFRFEDISRVCFFTDKDIEANQNALNKLKELRNGNK